MQTLTKGANTSINRNQIKVGIQWSPEKIAGQDVDPSAYLLGPSKKVRSDDDMIFYNQPKSKNGSIHYSDGVFSINLNAIPADVQKIALALTLHGSGNFSSASRVTIEVQGTASFSPDTSTMQEKALILGEVYRRNDQWKFRAVGQGFNGGLGPLATHFGVDIKMEEPTKPTISAPPAPTTKVILEKGNTRLSLDKNAWDLRRITIGAGWKASGRDIDVDLFAMCFDAKGTVVDNTPQPIPHSLRRGYAWASGVNKSKDGAIEHSGDSKGGDGAQDDEAMVFSLNRVSPSTQRIKVGLCLYMGKDQGLQLGHVRSAYLRVIDGRGKEMIRYQIEQAATLWKNTYSVLLAELSRSGSGWQFTSLQQTFPVDSQIELAKLV